MSRSVFLSFLGTNSYVPCNYYPEGEKNRMVKDVQYIQEATIPLFCEHFGENDVCYFFLTEKAKSANWENDGWWNNNTKKHDLQNEGLKSRLAKMGLSCKVEAVMIF